jgi:hypothetical protein
MTERKKTILEQALEYYRRSWCIIPIGKDKKAAVRWKQYQTNRPDEKQLQKWFSNGKKNIAVVLGEVSNGLTCRDFDTMAEYEQWAQAYPDLAGTLPTV